MTCVLLAISAQVNFEETAALRYAAAIGAQDNFELSLYIFSPAVEYPGQMDRKAALDWLDRETGRSEKLSLSTLESATQLSARAGVQVISSYVRSPKYDHATFLQAARVHDLIVLDAAGPNDVSAKNAIESVLFDSGRPLLLIPEQCAAFSCRRILIAWDGSSRSARAVKDALPFLMRSEAVVVLTVADEKDLSLMTPGANLKTYLARHGIDCQLVTLSGKAGDAAEVIRDFAARDSIDMLVMGAFVHSRLREVFLGGVTRSFLDDCPWPLLIEH